METILSWGIWHLPKWKRKWKQNKAIQNKQSLGMIIQAQAHSITKALLGRTHGGQSALSTQDMVHSQCITISEGSCSQRLRTHWLAIFLWIFAFLALVPPFGDFFIRETQRYFFLHSDLVLSIFPSLALVFLPPLRPNSTSF